MSCSLISLGELQLSSDWVWRSKSPHIGTGLNIACHVLDKFLLNIHLMTHWKWCLNYHHFLFQSCFYRISLTQWQMLGDKDLVITGLGDARMKNELANSVVQKSNWCSARAVHFQLRSHCSLQYSWPSLLLWLSHLLGKTDTCLPSSFPGGHPNVSCYDLLKLQGDNLGIRRICKPQVQKFRENSQTNNQLSCPVMGYKWSLFGKPVLK